MLGLSYGMWFLVPWLGIKPGRPAQAAWRLSQWDHQENSFLGALEAAYRNQSRRRAHWQDNKILLGSRAITSHLVSGGRDACISLCVLHFFLAGIIAGPQGWFTEDVDLPRTQWWLLLSDTRVRRTNRSHALVALTLPFPATRYCAQVNSIVLETKESISAWT